MRPRPRRDVNAASADAVLDESFVVLLLLKDDTRALARMRFQQGAFVSEDRSIVRYLRYVRSFPTNDPSRWLS
jgi:hypothetical protein